MSKRFDKFFIGQPILPDAYYNDLPEDYRRLAFTVSGLQKVELISRVMDDVKAGLEKFETFDKWKESIDPEFYSQFGNGQLQTVYRTTMSTAYTNGIIETSKATGISQQFAYQAILDDATRPNHEACDGIVRPINDPFWNAHTPPLGYNCRCTLIPLNEENEEPNTRGIDLQETRPDRGFGFQPKDLESHLNLKFRDQLKKLPADLRVAAIEGFAKKTSIVDDFLAENKKNFTKPKND